MIMFLDIPLSRSSAYVEIVKLSTSPVCNTAVLPSSLKETTRAASRLRISEIRGRHQRLQGLM